MAREDTVFCLRGERSYSQARRIGDLLYIAGTVSWDDDFKVIGEGEFHQQIQTIYADIGKTLDNFEVDASALVKETIYTIDMDALIAVNDIRNIFYQAVSPPASTWIAVERLATAKLLLEIEAIAQLPSDGRSLEWRPRTSTPANGGRTREVERQMSIRRTAVAGGLLMIGGVSSWDAEGRTQNPSDLGAQLTNIYEEIGVTLADHAIGFADIVKETIYTCNMASLVSAAPLRAAYFAGVHPPTSTWVQVERLRRKDLLLEVEITAALA